MSYANFIPTVWSEAIQRELERKRVFVEDCNRQWEGEIKQKGDTVRILGVGRPTVRSINNLNRNGAIEDPEEIENTSVSLVVDQIRYFNYMVGDVDRAQAMNGLMDALSKESAEALADEEDKYIARFAKDQQCIPLQDAAISLTTENVLETIDSAVERLYENDVSPSTELVLTVSPKFYTIFRRAYIGKDTDNSEILKNGRVAKYGNVTIKMSNNICREDGTDHLMIRTKRAIAFAQQMVQVEAYRPEKQFADAVKGLSLFGAKIVREKEMIGIKVTY